MIREDIAVAAAAFSAPGLPDDIARCDPIADAPAGVTYSVETPYDSTIVITIDNVSRLWGWSTVDGITTVSPALRALADELADIIDSYNYDGPDVGKRFFGRVRVQGETLSWSAPTS